MAKGKMKMLHLVRIFSQETDDEHALTLQEIIARQESLLTAFRSIGEYADGDPFVTLSFIALPVIPHVRITDMGVFDVTKMQFIQ